MEPRELQVYLVLNMNISLSLSLSTKVQNVLQAPWVPRVLKVLRDNLVKQDQKEIKEKQPYHLELGVSEENIDLVIGINFNQVT